MSVRLRLTRLGRRNRPYYRIAAFDNRSRRDGRPVEYLGTYDPLKKEGETVEMNVERMKHWLSVGAEPSETVASMLLNAGLTLPARRGRGVRSRASAKQE